MLQAVAGRLGMPAFQIKIFGLLSLCHLLVDIQQGALPALLPVLSETMSLSYAKVGLVLTVYSLTSSFAQPVFGILSDSSRHYILIPVGVMVAAMGLTIFGYAPTYGLILASAVMMGLGSAAYHPEATRTAYDLSGGRQGVGMAVWMFGGNLGVAIGPLLVSLLLILGGLQGLAVILPVVLLVTVPMLFMIRRATPEQWAGGASRDQTERRGQAAGTANWFGEILAVILVIFRTAILNGILVYLPFYYLYVSGQPSISPQLLQSILLFGGVAGSFSGGYMADRFGVKPVATTSSALLLAALPLLVYSQGPLRMVIAFIVGALLATIFMMAVLLGQRYIPQRASLSAALVNGGGLGIGGALTGVLGLVADVWGIPATIRVVLAIPLFLLIIAMLLPPVEAKAAG